MLIGVPKEVKIHEYRVGATPELVKLLVSAGHKVKVQKGAGEKIGYLDFEYEKAGAFLVKSAEEVYQAEMILKVKEPQPREYPLLQKNQILFCYLHLAAEPELCEQLMKSGCTAIAYETVKDSRGRLPLLTPMSEIAGRIAIQVGCTALQMNHGGRGVLIGGAPGVDRGKVVIIGGGIVGTEAARMALGLGAEVLVLDRDLYRLRELENLFGHQLSTRVSTQVALEEALANADLVIGAVLLPGKRAPRLITREMLKRMTPGAVIVDVAIDQGGIAETSRPTTHADPTYVVDGIIHYCVTNMPGACARTATQSLNNATAPYVLSLASKGYLQAIQEDSGLKEGVNVCEGQVVNLEVAEALGMANHAATRAALG